MDPILNIAVRAVRKFSNTIIDYYSNSEFNNLKKNLYTIILKGETLISKVIYDAYPQHSIVSVKNGSLYVGKKNIIWIINPLCGFINYLKFFPHFAISIAVCINGKTEVAVVYDYFKNELFSAVRGQSAQLNGYRLRNNYSKINNLLIAVSFSFIKSSFSTFFLNDIFKKLNSTYKIHIRCTGNSSLDLVYVASGRIDAYFDFNIKKKKYNFIAPSLIFKESGCIISDFYGNYINSFKGSIIAGNPKLIDILLQYIK